LGALVSLASIAHEIRVRVVGWARLRTLASGDGEALLREMRAREVIREVRGGEHQRAVSEAEHT
jgi:hypothetical protein